MKKHKTPATSSFDNSTVLGDLPGVRYLFVCPTCEHRTEISATKLMMLRGGAAKVVEVVASMQCSNCGRKGAPDVSIEENEK